MEYKFYWSLLMTIARSHFLKCLEMDAISLAIVKHIGHQYSFDLHYQNGNSVSPSLCSKWILIIPAPLRCVRHHDILQMDIFNFGTTDW